VSLDVFWYLGQAKVERGGCMRGNSYKKERGDIVNEI
jgi:hypothetical protein